MSKNITALWVKSFDFTSYESNRNVLRHGYQRGLASMDYKLLDKKTESGAIATTKVWASVNEELAQELHKLVIEKFKTRKTYTNHKDNIWAADLDELGSFSSKNWGIKVLLSLIVVFTKYARVKSLKDKESKTVFLWFYWNSKWL